MLRASSSEMAGPTPSVVGVRELRLLAEGGTARVWAAVREGDGGPVAVKVLQAEIAAAGGAGAAELLATFEALRQVRHPHLVEIRASGLTGEGLPYLVMELLAGRD